MRSAGSSALVPAAAVVVAVLATVGTARRVFRPRLAPLGAVATIAGLVVLGVTPTGVITVVAALVAGAGTGVASALPRHLLGHRPASGDGGRLGIAVVTVICVLAGGLVLWVGANDPAVQWFGNTYVHGPRNGNEVAITFDDGPDARWSLAVAEMLAAHDVKGTFFHVGKAVDARPDIARALYDDGHLLANHSYHHDYWRWLDPRYPELDRTQDTFRRHLGVCPGLFRPPHGQRTPFMLAHVHSKGMQAVMWDVSAQDWTDTDGRRVAQRVLDKVKPGSIILLHDGLDGHVTADRSVLATALPLILDGLVAKGLHAVRLDELLNLPAYLDDC